MDPRVARTYRHVLACARELLAEHGADSLTFTTVAERAGVSRNTLYRHWATREALVTDVLLRYHQPARPANGVSSRRRATVEFLHSMRDWLRAPANVAALTSLIAHAEHDSASEQALRMVTGSHRRLLAERAGPANELEYARLVGPVFFQMLVARRPVDDGFLDELLATDAGKS